MLYKCTSALQVSAGDKVANCSVAVVKFNFCFWLSICVCRSFSVTGPSALLIMPSPEAACPEIEMKKAQMQAAVGAVPVPWNAGSHPKTPNRKLFAFRVGEGSLSYRKGQRKPKITHSVLSFTSELSFKVCKILQLTDLFPLVQSESGTWHLPSVQHFPGSLASCTTGLESAGEIIMQDPLLSANRESSLNKACKIGWKETLWSQLNFNAIKKTTGHPPILKVRDCIHLDTLPLTSLKYVLSCCLEREWTQAHALVFSCIRAREDSEQSFAFWVWAELHHSKKMAAGNLFVFATETFPPSPKWRVIFLEPGLAYLTCHVGAWC